MTSAGERTGVRSLAVTEVLDGYAVYGTGGLRTWLLVGNLCVISKCRVRGGVGQAMDGTFPEMHRRR